MASCPAVPGGASTDPAVVTERHLKRSVLDAVIGEYKHYTGAASPLGAESKAKLAVHLDNIRNVESAARARGGGNRRRDDRGTEELQDTGRRHRSGKDVPYDLARADRAAARPGFSTRDFSAAFKLQGS